MEGDRITFLQIADAPHMSLDTLEWSRHHRCFPGQGTFDVTSVVAKVVELGYRGPLSLEVFSDVVRAAKAENTAWDAIRSLNHLEEQLQLHWQDAAARPSSRVSPHQLADLSLFSSPPIPANLEVGFVEIAVPEQDSQVAQVLAGLGFCELGRHRTKDVTWWGNGGANILLNAESPVGKGKTKRPLPFITSLGMELPDHQAVAERTRELAWPALRVSRGVGETTLPGVETPSQVEVFLSGCQGTEHHWSTDFLPAAATARTVRETGSFTGLDHFGIVVGRDSFESEVSFFRTILGVIPGPVSEFMEPNGRLRSRVLNPPGGDFRVVLNYGFGLGGRRWPGVNQIAYHCQDLLAQVPRFRAAGVPLIDIPANYYDDLQARFDLDPEFLQQLQDNSVLYDEDADGSFIHVYTEIVAGQFYIEVVERFGRYRGFGVPNTHVRIFAQHAAV